MEKIGRPARLLTAVITIFLIVSGCAGNHPPPSPEVMAAAEATDFRIGAGDTINVFVWRNSDLSVTVPVRPDGKITVPLVEDLEASGKTPTELAREIEEELSVYVKNPVVTIMVSNLGAAQQQQIRVLGGSSKPIGLPYRDGITLLDVIIAAGGIPEYGAGNRASIVRKIKGESVQFGVRLEDLVNQGDLTANLDMFPGDVLIIPEARF